MRAGCYTNYWRRKLGHPFGSFKSSVPIVGQAFIMLGGFATTQIQCGCEAKSPLLLVGGAPAVCPACRRMFVHKSFAFNGQNGQITVELGIGLAAPAIPDQVGATS